MSSPPSPAHVPDEPDIGNEPSSPVPLVSKPGTKISTTPANVTAEGEPQPRNIAAPTSAASGSLERFVTPDTSPKSSRPTDASVSPDQTHRNTRIHDTPVSTRQPSLPPKSSDNPNKEVPVYANQGEVPIYSTVSKNPKPISGTAQKVTSDALPEENEENEEESQDDDPPAPPSHVIADDNTEEYKPVSQDPEAAGVPPKIKRGLSSKIREHSRSSDSVFEIIRKIIDVVSATVGWTILLGFLNIVPLAMVIIGSIYWSDCPVEDLPLIMVIGGIGSLIKGVLDMYFKWRQLKYKDNPDENKKTQDTWKKAQSLFDLFQFAWFIAANVLVYRTDPNTEDPASPEYCHPVMYDFSYWIITIVWIILGFFITMLIILPVCCLCVFRSLGSRN